MNNSCITGTFSEFYRTESRSELWVSFFLTILCMVIYAAGIIVILRGSLDARQIVILISVAACLALLLLLVLKDGCSLGLFPIVGKEGMLTILDNKHVLRSGESIRLWSRPLKVVMLPLAGASTEEFEVGSLERFPQLDYLVDELDFSVPGEHVFEVSVSYTWTLPQVDSKGILPEFFNEQPPWKLSEYIKSLFDQAVVELAHALAHKKFSDLMRDEMTLLLSRAERRGLPYHVQIQSVAIQLVTTTTTRISV